MSTLSSHVLDTSLGRPAAGIRVTASRAGQEIGSGVTNADGRVKDLHGGSALTPGLYVLTFVVGPYFAASKRDSFYDTISVELRIGTADHYHVPLILSPFGYSTYRGS
jgi:5-hydroxyisourate hydrolase